MKIPAQWNWLKIHIICWTVFICYEIIVGGAIEGSYGYFWINIGAYIVYISFFYFHAHVVLPNGLKRKNQLWWRLPLMVVGGLLAFVFIYAYVNLTIRHVINVSRVDLTTLEWATRQYLAALVIRTVYFLFLSTGYYFFVRTVHATKQEADRRLRIKELRVELLRSELNHLREQINPHLLFNTLSFIRYSTKHSPQQAKEAILLLSNILRFATNRRNEERVRLKDEVEQVNHVIALNRLRFGDRMNIQFDRDIEDDTIAILPLVLLTLVENVFKHGNLRERDCPATIEVITSPDILVYRTRNLIDKSASKENSGGTGLENTRLRLEKEFPDSFSFKAQKEGDWFEVELIVVLESTVLRHEEVDIPALVN